MAAYTDDLCSPQRHSGLPWRSQSPEVGRRIVVEDVVEPFGLTPSPVSVPSQSYANGHNYKDKHFRSPQGRSRSPMHGALAPILDVHANGYDQTDVTLPYNSTSENEIANKYSSDIDRQTTAFRYDLNGAYDISAAIPPVFPLKKVDPYSVPLGEKENIPYRGPLVRTIDQSTCRDLEKGAGYAHSSKLKNSDPLSDERIEELSNRYRERMARQKHRESSGRLHIRSRSDNSINRESNSINREGTASVTEHRELCDNLIIKKYETAMLQIDKLEGNIKHLKLEVNTLQAAKNQGEMRVSYRKF